jgi:Cu(I)/Ag(I) efflux system periplasmic protein CusF
MKHWILAATLATAALGAAAQATEAEVRKVDKAQGKLTLKHAEVKHLDMPPMTMVFRVSDPALLDGLAVGDKLRVDIAKVDGQYTVTALRKAP